MKTIKKGKCLHICFSFSHFFALAMAIFIISFNKEVFKNNLATQLFMGVFFLLVISSFFTNMPYIANGVFAEEVCYVKNKVFYYTKTRNFLRK